MLSRGVVLILDGGGSGSAEIRPRLEKLNLDVCDKGDAHTILDDCGKRTRGRGVSHNYVLSSAITERQSEWS